MQHRRAVVCLLLVGCGANSVPGSQDLAGPLPVWTAAASGEPFAVPHVEVALNGHPVDVMVDTGASQHFVLSAAAWAYDVQSEPFEALATDAHGARFEVRLAAPGSLHIPGRSSFVPPYVFLVDSHSLWSSGVLGGISPQLLAPAGYAAVLDLAGGRLEVTPARAADPARDAQARVCRAGADSRDGWRYVVPVRVGGREASLLIDTGAQSTTIYEGSPLAATLLASSSTRSIRIAGAASVVEMRVIDDVPIEIGRTVASGRVTVGPSRGQCDEDGLLGFDVLRRCRLTLEDRRATLRCAESDPPLHRAPARARPTPMVLTRVDTTPACGRSADQLAPLRRALPERYSSAIDAYVALSTEIGEHAAHIEQACTDDGYFEAQIHPTLEREGQQLRVSFAVEEGRRFRVRDVTVTLIVDGSSRALEAGELPELRTRQGLPYRREDVVADAHTIADALTDRGLSAVEAMFGRNTQDEGTVDVHFAIAAEPAASTSPRLARPVSSPRSSGSRGR